MKKQEVRAFLEDYGLRLRNERINAKMSQLQVAKIIGCSQAIISHIECGYMLPPPKIETALFDIYGINEL